LLDTTVEPRGSGHWHQPAAWDFHVFAQALSHQWLRDKIDQECGRLSPDSVTTLTLFGYALGEQRALASC